MIQTYYEIDGDTQAPAEKQLLALLRRTDIQAVIIGLPITQQPRFIKLAWEHGMHVLSEKPIAASSRDAIDLIRLHETKYPHLIWAVTECFRYEPAFAYAAEQVRKLGKLTFFTFNWAIEVLESNPYYQTSWRTVPDYQGGFLLDAGVHFASELRQILGQEIKQVAAFGRQVKPFLPPVDTISSICLLSGGASGTFTLSVASNKTLHQLTIVGDNGTVVVETENDASSDASMTFVVSAPECKEGKAFESCGVDRGIAAFAKEVTDGKQEARSMPREALADLRIIEALLRSGESGGKLIFEGTT